MDLMKVLEITQLRSLSPYCVQVWLQNGTCMILDFLPVLETMRSVVNPAFPRYESDKFSLVKGLCLSSQQFLTYFINIFQ